MSNFRCRTDKTCEEELRRVSPEVMIRGTCGSASLAGPRLLDLVEKFTVVWEHKAGPVKVFGQNYQFLGVKNAIARCWPFGNGPRVCDPQQLRQDRTRWIIPNNSASRKCCGSQSRGLLTARPTALSGSTLRFLSSAQPLGTWRMFIEVVCPGPAELDQGVRCRDSGNGSAAFCRARRGLA